jgi:hypothetical protein
MTFGDGEGKGQNLVSLAHQPAGESAISPDQADRGELLAQQGQQPKRPVAVLHRGRGEGRSKESGTFGGGNLPTAVRVCASQRGPRAG